MFACRAQRITMNSSKGELDAADKHDIFKRDPSDLVHYVYKEVSIITIDGLSHTGWVYAADPVSLSFGLLRFSDRRAITETELIMGHAVRDITIVDDAVDTYKNEMDVLFKSKMPTSSMSSEEVSRKRERVMSWLLKNRIPVQTCAGQPELISVGDVLFVHPPYSAESCQSGNEIVLGKIQTLIGNMPLSSE